MAKKVYMAGVGNLELFKGADKIVSSQTLIESSIAIGVTLEDIRAGQGAGLIGKFAHSSTFDLTITDALFSMEYIALNVGSDIVIGGDSLVVEEVEAEEGSITIKGTPVDFGGLGTIGWYGETGKPIDKSIKFSGKKANAPGLAAGTKVCVQYNAFNDGLRQITVPSSIIPSECKAILTANLYAGETFEIEKSTKVGTVVVEIPRFMLNGTQDLAMSMTGASQTNLSGTALQSFEGASCDGGGYYSKIKEIIVGNKWYNNGVVDLAVQGNDLKAQDYIVTRAIYANAIPTIINPADLQYQAVSPANVTVDATGKITTVTTAGNVKVTVKAAGAPSEVKALVALVNVKS